MGAHLVAGLTLLSRGPGLSWISLGTQENTRPSPAAQPLPGPSPTPAGGAGARSPRLRGGPCSPASLAPRRLQAPPGQMRRVSHARPVLGAQGPRGPPHRYVPPAHERGRVGRLGSGPHTGKRTAGTPRLEPGVQSPPPTFPRTTCCEEEPQQAHPLPRDHPHIHVPCFSAHWPPGPPGSLLSFHSRAVGPPAAAEAGCSEHPPWADAPIGVPRWLHPGPRRQRPDLCAARAWPSGRPANLPPEARH